MPRSYGRSPGQGAPAPASAGEGRPANSTLARGLALLSAFKSAADMLSNGELVRRTGLPKPTVSRLTATLTGLGYLVHLPEQEKYQLGPALLTLGMAFFRESSFSQLIRPHLQHLADTVQANVLLAVRHGPEAVVIQLHYAITRRLAVRIDIGDRLPVATTAVGAALLSALVATEREAVLAPVLPPPGAVRESILRRLAAGLEGVERLGYATALGTWEPDINGIAAPIRAAGSGTVMAIGVSGPSQTADETMLRKVAAPGLRAVVTELRRAGLIL